MKICKSCKIQKISSGFHVSWANIDGLSARCRKCTNAQEKENAAYRKAIDIMDSEIVKNLQLFEGINKLGIKEHVQLAKEIFRKNL